MIILSLLISTASWAEDNDMVDVRIIQSKLEYNSNNHSREYILGANDTISIFVYDAEEFNQDKIRVQPDGNIIITPLGSIKASGKTLEELHTLLVNKYKFYLKEPQVTIRLDQTKPFVAYIRGAVLNPGSYELNTDTSSHYPFASSDLSVLQIERKSPLLSNLLVVAGGVKFDADLEHIKISNKTNNSEFEVNLMKILENGDINQDVYLMAGDIITVPSLPTPLAVSEEHYKKYMTSTFSPKYVPVKVFGYVTKPGLIKLDSSASITINSAIMSAGIKELLSAEIEKQNQNTKPEEIVVEENIINNQDTLMVVNNNENNGNFVEEDNLSEENCSSFNEALAHLPSTQTRQTQTGQSDIVALFETLLKELKQYADRTIAAEKKIYLLEDHENRAKKSYFEVNSEIRQLKIQVEEKDKKIKEYEEQKKKLSLMEVQLKLMQLEKSKKKFWEFWK